MQLNATEAVLARCGTAERLLLRVKRVAARPAPEPPLAKREAEPQAASKAGKPPRLSVLVLFVDSLGRRHFFRRMPKAAAALEAVARSRRASLYQFFRWVWWPSLVCGCPARFVACQCGAACLLQVSLQPSVWPSG